MLPASDSNVEQTGQNEERSEELLSLHIAEYEALMNRCNYFIMLHVGVWGVMVSLAVFLIQQWSIFHHGTIIWIGGAAIQSLLHIWVTLIEEQYLAVSYIENELRHSIIRAAPALVSRKFWRYEAFLACQRPPASWWGEWIVPVALLVALAFAVYWRWNFIVAELPLVILNAGLMVVLAHRTHSRVTLRRSFTKRFDHP